MVRVQVDFEFEEDPDLDEFLADLRDLLAVGVPSAEATVNYDPESADEERWQQTATERGIDNGDGTVTTAMTDPVTELEIGRFK